MVYMRELWVGRREGSDSLKNSKVELKGGDECKRRAYTERSNHG